MKVMVMVKATKSSEAGALPSAELLEAMGKFNEELVNNGIMLAGEGLKPSSEAVRVRFSGNNRSVIDGPFAETKELVAGYWIWKVKDMQEAIAWVKRCPNPMPEDSDIDIRPVYELDDFGEVVTDEFREHTAVVHAKAVGLTALRFEERNEGIIAGLKRHYTVETRTNIPDQWRLFLEIINDIPSHSGSGNYGVSMNMGADCSFDYIAGVEVDETKGLPENIHSITLAENRYAVFTHQGHVSTIADTLDLIWSKWVPDCGLKISESPCFEYYTDQFDPVTGFGGIEIWVPVKIGEP